MNYIYRQSEKHLWTVGFFNEANKFEPESDHDSIDDAAERVHYLNGGDRKQAKRLRAIDIETQSVHNVVSVDYDNDKVVLESKQYNRTSNKINKVEFIL